MAAATPDYLNFLDNLFGGQTHMEYLDRMTASGTMGAGATGTGLTLPSTEQAADPTTPAAAPTEYSGKTINIEGAGPVAIEDFEQWRAKEGLADPNAFKLDDYEAYTHGGSYARGENSDWQGYVAYRPKEGKTGFSTGLDQWVSPSDMQQVGMEGVAKDYRPDQGVMAYAGALKDDPQTRVAYTYDKDGSMQGAHFSALGNGLKNDLKAMAPALTFLFAPFLPGLGAAVAGGVQAVVPALGAMGSQIAGGAIVGGGMAAATGQNIGKGALLGGVGSGISAMNPAGSLGIADKATQGLVNSGISTAVKTGLNTNQTRR